MKTYTYDQANKRADEISNALLKMKLDALSVYATSPDNVFSAVLTSPDSGVYGVRLSFGWNHTEIFSGSVPAEVIVKNFLSSLA